MKPWLRLLRVPLAPTAVCDACACALLALESADAAPSDFGIVAWALLGLTSLLLYGAGMAANDLADRERDRFLNPDRPLASGALRPAPVTALVVLLAAGALALGGGPRGSFWAVLVAVLAAALYNFKVKNRVVGGAVAMGTVRAANASIAVWPLVLEEGASWTALLGPLCIGVYSAAVTLLSTTEEQPAPRRALTSRILAALAFAGAATLAWITVGRVAVAVLLGAALAYGVASSTLFGRTPRPGPPRRQVLEMLLGLYLLAYVLACAGDGGSPWVGLGGLVLAFALVFATQMMVRALAIRTPPAERDA